MSGRRHPIIAGDRVKHIDSRVGIVVELLPVNGLPGARVDWLGGGSDLVPLGYLDHVHAEDDA